jgi:protein TonB
MRQTSSHMAPGRYSYNKEPAPHRAGLAIALALHAIVIVAILAHPPARSAFAEAMPIMVSLIAPEPVPAPVQAPPEPPKPRPVRPKVERPVPKPVEPPLLAAAPRAPEPVVAPAPPPPPPPADEVPPPEPVAAAAVIAPRFDATYLQNPPPAYPALARRMKEQGKVLLRVFVTPDGAADRIELRKSSGSERLDNAALDTVRRWRFVPARQGDHPVSAWVIVPISFSLEG